MSFENKEVFTKKNIDLYLNELSKEYKRLGGRNTPVEIVLIGGAAIIENYGFRDMTTDIDAIIPAASILKDAIQRVGNRFGLPDDWMNADFIMTDSYSPRLSAHSVYYRTFNQVLIVRMINAEYLIAMKLRSGRRYKNDLSDVAGILTEQERKGFPISFEMIDSAVKNLYGGWDRFPDQSLPLIQRLLREKNYAEAYQEIRESELAAKKTLIEFETEHPEEIRKKGIDAILDEESNRADKPSILKHLEELKNLQSEKVTTSQNNRKKYHHTQER